MARGEAIDAYLYLTNGFPFPLTSGYLRHYHLIRGLSEHHEVTLMSMVGRSFTNEHRDALAPFTSRIETFGQANGKRSKASKPSQRCVRRSRVRARSEWSKRCGPP